MTLSLPEKLKRLNELFNQAVEGDVAPLEQAWEEYKKDIKYIHLEEDPELFLDGLEECVFGQKEAKHILKNRAAYAGVMDPEQFFRQTEEEVRGQPEKFKKIYDAVVAHVSFKELQEVVKQEEFNQSKGAPHTGFHGRTAFWRLCFHIDTHPNFTRDVLMRFVDKISLEQLLENALTGEFPLQCLADPMMIQVVLAILQQAPGVISDEILDFEPPNIIEPEQKAASLRTCLDEMNSQTDFIKPGARNNFFNMLETLKQTESPTEEEVDNFIDLADAAQNAEYDTACYEAGVYLSAIGRHEAAIAVLGYIYVDNHTYQSACEMRAELCYKIAAETHFASSRVYYLGKAVKNALQLTDAEKQRALIKKYGSFYVGETLQEPDVVVDASQSDKSPQIAWLKHFDIIRTRRAEALVSVDMPQPLSPLFDL